MSGIARIAIAHPAAVGGAWPSAAAAPGMNTVARPKARPASIAGSSRRFVSQPRLPGQRVELRQAMALAI